MKQAVALLLVCAALSGGAHAVPPGVAGGGGDHPLDGMWNVSTPGHGSACVTIGSASKGAAVYSSSSGDMGGIGSGGMGGFAFQSTVGGGNGLIQHQAGDTYTWFNYFTMVGGTMTPK
jgi:hypothetical protein